MDKITSIILHYQRPANLPLVIAGIRKQTISSNIIVWDNSGDAPECGQDVTIRSSKNFHCLPRVLIAGTVHTEYIYNQDDDLAIKPIDIFERFLEMSKLYDDDFVIGWNGRKVKGLDIDWSRSYSFPKKNEEAGGGWVDAMQRDDYGSIDMINFGVSFLPTRLINQIKLNPFFGMKVTEREYKHGDDMIISAQLEKKRVMDFDMKKEYDWLPEGQGLSKTSGHMEIRDELMRRFWGPK